MAIYGIERHWIYGDYRFAVGYDSGGGCDLDERMIEVQERTAQGWGDSCSIRSFYFEDVQERHMRNFCRKYAEDADYRAACAAGSLDWAVRDALFERNAHAPWEMPRSLWPTARLIGEADVVWLFIKRHYREIIALPEYQRIQALDLEFDPDAGVALDPLIAPAVAAFNAIPGVQTRWSCQGVSGTVPFQGYEIQAVSHHRRLAFIAFAAFPPDLLAAARALMAQTRMPAIWEIIPSIAELTLYATGDNLAFRGQAITLAQELGRLAAGEP